MVINRPQKDFLASRLLHREPYCHGMLATERELVRDRHQSNAKYHAIFCFKQIIEQQITELESMCIIIATIACKPFS